MSQLQSTLSQPILSKMTEHTIISVKGADAGKFLQGQCTCDINMAIEGRFLLGAQCNAKGRMLCSFLLIKLDDDEYGLRMRSSIVESTLASLQKYSVFFKVKLSVSSLEALAIFGDNLGHLLTSPPPSLGDIPNIGYSQHHNDLIISHQSYNTIEIWGQNGQLQAVSDMLGKHTNTENAAYLNSHLIAQGIVEITQETQGQYVPQHLNFHLVGGVNFKKGCYTGQEIIARLHYRGQLKKHTYLATINSPSPIIIGSDITLEEESDRSIGQIVACSPNFITETPQAEQQLLLICINDEFYLNNASLIEKSSKAKISWSSLPYAIT